MIIGEFSLQMDLSRREEPVVGDFVVVSILGERVPLEVLRISRYKFSRPEGATHLVRLRRLSLYTEDERSDRMSDRPGGPLTGV